MNDALDDILADSDDEAEENAIVSQVLDEIGIEISGKVRSYYSFSMMLYFFLISQTRVIFFLQPLLLVRVNSADIQLQLGCCHL